MQNIINTILYKADFIQALSLKEQFEMSFIEEERWKLYLEGLQTTLIVTFFALLLGILIGSLVSIVRSTYDKNYGEIKFFKTLFSAFKSIGNKNYSEMKSAFWKVFMFIINMISKIYLTVIRGTPVVIQIMIIYYIVFPTSNNKILMAVLAFGINSGAYVAEIFRSGIMSIDGGQFEAGRSLGFNYVQTMIYVIVPQAFKNVLPTLANEFIVLLKETAVCGYVALVDLTRAGDIIRAATYTAYMPLFGVAAMYLIMVMFFTWLVGILERRLRNDER